ncbi:hypothetical protein ACFPM0_15755 [Pseudonocardia sulfidoxydans]
MRRSDAKIPVDVRQSIRKADPTVNRQPGRPVGPRAPADRPSEQSA